MRHPDIAALAAHPQHLRALPLLLLLALAFPTTALAEDDRDHALLLMVDVFGDTGTDSGNVQVGPLEDSFDEDADVGPSLSLTLGYLAGITKALRAGVTLRYFGEYSYDPAGDGDEVIFGTLIEGSGRIEYLLPLTEGIDAFGAGELGIAMLLPTGDLQDDLDVKDTQGYNIWSMPRLGFVAGPELGARYALADWVGARAGVALLYEQLWLYDAEVDSGDSSADRGYSLTRLRISLGLEAQF